MILRQLKRKERVIIRSFSLRPRKPADELSELINEALIPVSYTHLDVYKRQAIIS